MITYENREIRQLWVTRIFIAILLLLSFAFLFSVLHFYFKIGVFYSALFGLLLWSRLFAWFASRWLVHGVDSYVRWISYMALAPLNGNYYAFDGLRVRIECDESGRCRVLADDVFRVMCQPMDSIARQKLAIRYGPDGFFKDSRRRWWFAEETVLLWLSLHAERHEQRTLRFSRWLEREVFPPLRNKQRSMS
ncbi:MAG: hypothetical protein HY066_04920 [Betaproteobacteria bacterium]|nr:hypothetical protein [Betaproteobacteria bacterium]